ncbi:MAG: hypothetical protein ABI475_11250 [Methylophilaceae bacterium]
MQITIATVKQCRAVIIPELGAFFQAYAKELSQAHDNMPGLALWLN